MKNLLIVHCLLGISLVFAVPVDQGGSQFADDDSSEELSSFEEWFYRRPIGWNPFFRNPPFVDHTDYGENFPDLNLMIIITDFEKPDTEDDSYECDEQIDSPEIYVYTDEKNDDNSNQRGSDVPPPPQRINWDSETSFVQAPEPPTKNDNGDAPLNHEITKSDERLSPDPQGYDQTEDSDDDDHSSGNYETSENIDKPLVNDAYQPPSDQQYREFGRTLSQADDDFDSWLFNDSDDSDNSDGVSDGESDDDFDDDSDTDSDDDSDDNSNDDPDDYSSYFLDDDSDNDSDDDSNYDFDDDFDDYLTDDSDSDDDYYSSGDYNSDDTEVPSFDFRRLWFTK